MTASDALKRGLDILRFSGIDGPLWEARVTLAHVLRRSVSGLGPLENISFSPGEEECFFSLIDRRARGEPLQYVIGCWDFYGREFMLSPSVLIPRPETEQLVELILGRELPAGPRILDVGTGSGAIGITLALEMPGSTVIATDLFQDAAGQAMENAARLGAGNYLAVTADLCAGVRGPFQAVAANLPYIPSREIGNLESQVRDHEPVTALDGGKDGTSLILRLVESAGGIVSSGGFIALETGFDQGDLVTGFFPEDLWTDIQTHRDLAGRHRFVSAVRRSDGF